MRHRLDVLRVLATSDLRVRYGRGRLRFLKWILDPLAALGVYLLLVAIVLSRGEDAIGLSLACAVIPFTLLMASVVNALDVGPAARLDHPQHGLSPDADPDRLGDHRDDRVQPRAWC